MGLSSLLCCISKDVEKRALYKDHRQLHLISFLHGAIPIMAAATISRAVSLFLVACIGNGDIADQIVAYFMYSLFVAHIVGYLVALYLKGNKLFDYYFELATDNASFSWNSTLTLAIINWLYKEKSFAIAISAWICLIILVIVVIYCSNYVQDKVIRPSKETKYVLRNFESESFALAISYSFTVIIAVSIYQNASTNYLSNTDDINPTTDDGNKTYPLDWIFFGYVVFITVVLVYIQQKADKKQDKRLSLFHETSADAFLSQKASINSPGPTNPPGVEVAVSSVINALHRSTSKTADVNSSTQLNSNVQEKPSYNRFIEWLFWWDDDRSTISCFKCLMNTTAGYLVGCGWNVWAILTFTAYFRFPHGEVVASFLFAFAMTVVVIAMMTQISVREEVKVRRAVGEGGGDVETSAVNEPTEQEEEEEKIRNGTAGRGDLLFIFGRLSVGWAWQEFVFDVTSLAIPMDSMDREWLIVLVGVLNAIFVCYLGGVVLRYFDKKKDNDSDTGNSSNKSDHSNSGSDGSKSGTLNKQSSAVDPHDPRRSNSDSSLETPLL